MYFPHSFLILKNSPVFELHDDGRGVPDLWPLRVAIDVDQGDLADHPGLYLKKNVGFFISLKEGKRLWEKRGWLMDIFVKRGQQQRKRNSKRAVGEGERERERFWLHRNTVRRELLWLAGFSLCILWEILSIFIGTRLTSKKKDNWPLLLLLRRQNRGGRSRDSEMCLPGTYLLGKNSALRRIRRKSFSHIQEEENRKPLGYKSPSLPRWDNTFHKRKKKKKHIFISPPRRKWEIIASRAKMREKRRRKLQSFSSDRFAAASDI